MKIAIDVSQSVYEGTGVARYTQNLVRSLLDITNDTYILFGSTLRKQKELADFISSLPKNASYSAKISWLPPTVLSFLWNSIHYVPFEKFSGDVQIIHTSDWTEPPSKYKKVTTIHDLMVYRFPENFPKSIVKNHMQKLNWVKKESQCIIADSQSTKEDIMHYLAISENKIKVVHLGVESLFFPQSIDLLKNLKKRLGIKNAYILCVGTREPRKNLARISKAFSSLALKNHQLVIVGNAGWGDDVHEEGNTIITGFITNQELAVLYTGAQCFVYPSLFEGFGLPVLEAFACGAPVITSNRGSLKEINDPAIIVDPESISQIADGIKTVIELPTGKRKALVQKGILHARKFTWEKTALKTHDIYKTVVGA